MLRDLRGAQFPVIRPFEPHGQSPTRFSFCAQQWRIIEHRRHCTLSKPKRSHLSPSRSTSHRPRYRSRWRALLAFRALGVRGHINQCSDQPQQGLLLRSTSTAQKLAQFDVRQSGSGWRIGLVNDESPAAGRFAAEKPGVPVRAAIEFPPLGHNASFSPKHIGAQIRARNSQSHPEGGVHKGGSDTASSNLERCVRLTLRGG